MYHKIRVYEGTYQICCGVCIIAGQRSAFWHVLCEE